MYLLFCLMAAAMFCLISSHSVFKNRNAVDYASTFVNDHYLSFVNLFTCIDNGKFYMFYADHFFFLVLIHGNFLILLANMIQHSKYNYTFIIYILF